MAFQRAEEKGEEPSCGFACLQLQSACRTPCESWALPFKTWQITVDNSLHQTSKLPYVDKAKTALP